MTSQQTLQLGTRPAPARQGCIRVELSSDALTIIGLHERAGGNVTVRRHGASVRWRVDGGPEMRARPASEELARLRRDRIGSPRS